MSRPTPKGPTPKGLSKKELERMLSLPIEEEPEILEKEATISYDGRQYLIRIPNEISEILKIQKRDKILFQLTIPPPHTDEEITTTIKLKKKQ